jgi:acetylornithine deacetylase/succinyl-diaminopimelate desuccinylase-like protein
LTELTAFLSIPSISALSQHKPDMQRAAQWLVDQSTALGLHQARINQTTGHPIVTAEWLDAGPDKPTVLIYGHYDVQPVDPIKLWKSDPFKPEVRDNYLYARGASDDKGQAFIYFKALEAFFKSSGRLPVNVKLLIEEKSAGPADAFIEQHHEALTADVAVISDTAAAPATVHRLRPARAVLHPGDHWAFVICLRPLQWRHLNPIQAL